MGAGAPGAGSWLIRPGPILTPLTAILNYAGLALLSLGIAETGRVGTSGSGLTVAVLFALAVVGWVTWTATRLWPVPPAVLPLSLGVMAGAGGALTGFASLGMVFPAVAALGATLGLSGRRAAAVVIVALVALTVSTPLAGTGGAGTEVGGVAAVLAGSVMGLSRRALQERQEQQASVRIAEAQAEAQRARAELLDGRNHLARELHDVLAHTLSALSLQLEALDALMPGGPPSPAVAAQLADIRRLVHEGLDEARGAVAALREDLPPLDERLRKLCASRGVAPTVTGASRPLPADVSLCLYRVAQEALTNAVRHAPGALPQVQLAYGPAEVTVTVANAAPAATERSASRLDAPDGAGGGYGLQGIRERVLLTGGSVEAGPCPSGPFAGGWKVEARVPVGP